MECREADGDPTQGIRGHGTRKRAGMAWLEHGLHCHEKFCGLVGCNPHSVLEWPGSQDAHEGHVASGSP